MSLYDFTIALKAFLIANGGADAGGIRAEFPEAGEETIIRGLCVVMTSFKRGKVVGDLTYFADPVRPGSTPHVSMRWLKR
jgi:hypothetical protein